MSTLKITENFNAPCARLFAAWSAVDQLQRWFGPGDMRVPEASVDLRPGGRYRIVMQAADGERHIVSGQYRDIVPNQRLSFTWQWEGSEAITLVTLHFREVDAGTTELTLEHTQFANDEVRDHHQRGWAGCLAGLRRWLSA